jgi:hypothetical protein
MTGSILHFGQDACFRIPLLQGAGYVVRDCPSGIQLRSFLQSGTITDAVVLTEGYGSLSKSELSLTRSRSAVPFIVFEEQDQSLLGAPFDLVIPFRADPVQWIGDIDALIATSRAVRVRSRQLVEDSIKLAAQTEKIIARTRREIARSRQERSRQIEKISCRWEALDSNQSSPGAGAVSDESRELDHQILCSLARLTQILHKMIAEAHAASPASEPYMALDAVRSSESAILESLLTQWKTQRNQSRN